MGPDYSPPSYEALFKNRFASHVCQTLFEVAVDSVAREVRQLVAVPHPHLSILKQARGDLPAVKTSSDEGELRTVTQLTIDIAEVRSWAYTIRAPLTPCLGSTTQPP